MERRSVIALELLALADDLTGALETGARFSAEGVAARVSTAASVECDVPVLVIDTETRHASPADAAARVSELAVAALARGVRFFFKKTDSTLRGNIGAELGALRHAVPGAPLVYAPAYPALGRTVRAGELYVDGVAVHRTAFARDPRHPVHDSNIRRVLAAQTDEEILVCDGETDADVLRAAQLAVRGRTAAGPGAMAGALARTLDLPRAHVPVWPPLGNFLLVNGSRHPASLAQEAYAETHGWLVLRILECPGESPDSRARRTALEVVSALEAVEAEVLVIFGGDTAFAIIDALGRPPIDPVRELVPGIPLARTIALGRTLWLITKAGGFGAPDAMDAIRSMMERGS